MLMFQIMQQHLTMKTRPPTMLPSVTGIKFWKMNWLKVKSAPRAMPRGIRNLQETAAHICSAWVSTAAQS
jgi:hypothetical protein